MWLISMNNILPTLIKGFVIGISIAAPVGPIGVLCIRRTLANGRLAASSPAWAPPARTWSTARSPPSD